MNEKLFNQIVGKKSLVNAMKDSDGDGYGNLIDCRPYNKNKQGWIHDAAKAGFNAIKNKALADRDRDREERIAYEVSRENARSAASEERAKQAVETAKYKVRQEAIREREMISRRSKMGGGIDYLRSAGRSIHRPAQIYGSSSSPQRKKVTKYVKKGNHYVKRTSYKSVGGVGNYRNNAAQMNDPIPNLRL